MHVALRDINSSIRLLSVASDFAGKASSQTWFSVRSACSDFNILNSALPTVPGEMVISAGLNWLETERLRGPAAKSIQIQWQIW